MAGRTSIEWTEATWNPVTGCSHISLGCMNCYAERMARRLQAMGQRNYSAGFNVVCHDHLLEAPLRWRKPLSIFVNSMSDLFHDDVPDDFILKVFHVMNESHRHRFQVLTKRSARLISMSDRLPWSDNIWMGVSVENSHYTYRIKDLQGTGAVVRFLSLEPLLGPIKTLELSGIDWVITGGESGPGARSMCADWIRDIRDQCLIKGVPFFFKQWGGVNKKKNGRMLDGRIWNQAPV